jgi:DNA-binding transcriptional LysR family regulator
MSPANFDLNLLRVFEALVSESHVTRASERLFLSQSATSHALNRLREQLHDPILIRCGAGLQPTPRALSMLSDVRDILRRVDNTLNQPAEFDPSTSERHFTLAVTDFFEAVMFPALMQQLADSAPGVVIDLEMIGPAASMQDLEDGRVDMVVGIDSSASLPAHLIREPWLSERPACLVGKQFDDIPDSLTLRQYLALPHVTMLDQTDSSTTGIDRWLAGRKQKRQHCAQMINYLAAARLVSQRRALLTLPQRMAELFCDWLPVTMVKAPSAIPSWDMSLVVHPLQQQDSGIRWLKENIKAC